MKNPKVALFASLEAKPGREKDVEDFLEKALSMVNQEPRTPVWFALKLGPSSYGVFDSFYDDDGRQNHLHGPVAKALMQAADLFAKPVKIDPIDVLGVKLP